MRFNPRRWHSWLGALLSLPMLIIGVTAILMIHAPSLGWRELQIDTSWLPGYHTSSRQDPRRQVQALLETPQGLWIGTRAGLFLQHGAVLDSIAAFDGQEIRALLTTPQGLLVLTPQGLWRARPQGWQSVLPGQITAIFAPGQDVYAVLRGHGLLRSGDGGQSWRRPPEPAAFADLPAMSQPSTVAVAKLIRDLHTGEALFTHDLYWLWVDLLGVVLIFLACSGFYLWWRVQRAQASSRRRLQPTSSQ
jgi:hypothetical protein